MFEWILLVHVLAASTWFGAQVYVEGLTASAARTRDADTIMTVGLRVAQTSHRVLGVAGILTFVSGVWITFVSGYTFEMFFVIIGIAVAVVGIAVNWFFFKPRTVKLEAVVAEGGLAAPEAMATLKGLTMTTRVMTLLLAVAMILMVLKPWS